MLRPPPSLPPLKWVTRKTGPDRVRPDVNATHARYVRCVCMYVDSASPAEKRERNARPRRGLSRSPFPAIVIAIIRAAPRHRADFGVSVLLPPHFFPPPLPALSFLLLFPRYYDSRRRDRGRIVSQFNFACAITSVRMVEPSVGFHHPPSWQERARQWF